MKANIETLAIQINGIRIETEDGSEWTISVGSGLSKVKKTITQRELKNIATNWLDINHKQARQVEMDDLADFLEHLVDYYDIREEVPV